MRPSRRAVLAWPGALWAARGARADDYPGRAVRVVVPYVSGSATDILARTIARKLSETWGEPVVAENRPGAGGTIGAALVARSTPDGLTLMVQSAAQAVNPFIYPRLPYDTLHDFVQVAAIAGQPDVLVVAMDSGYRTLADLLVDARKRPGELNFGSAGIGGDTDIDGEKFKQRAGIDVVRIPYTGAPEALADTIAGRIAYFFAPISAALPLLRAGRLRALAVSSARRSSVLPEVPTVAESGLPGFDYKRWVGLFAPAGTPASVVGKINRDVDAALDDPAVQARMRSLGAEPMAMSPAAFDHFLRAEMDDAALVVKAGHVRLQ